MSSLTVKEIHDKADEYINVQKGFGNAKKRREAFWKYISTESGRVSGYIKKLQRGEIIESEKEKDHIFKELQEVYNLWVNKYDMERSAQRKKSSVQKNIPTSCSKLVLPAMDTTIRKKKGTVLACLMTINSYCKKYKSTTPKNLAEQAFFNICISPMLKYTDEKMNSYSKFFLIGKKKQIEKKSIINTLCGAGQGSLAGLSTAARALVAYSSKMCKTIKDSNYNENKVKSCYNEFVKLYGPISISEKQFVNDPEACINLRIAAKILSESFIKSVDNILNMIKALNESAKDIKI